MCGLKSCFGCVYFKFIVFVLAKRSSNEVNRESFQN